MPLFEVKIETRVTYVSSIIIKAKTEDEAIEYAKNNDDYYFDLEAEHSNSYKQSQKPLAAKRFKESDKLPGNWSLDSIPYGPNKGDRTISDYLADKET